MATLLQQRANQQVVQHNPLPDKTSLVSNDYLPLRTNLQVPKLHLLLFTLGNQLLQILLCRFPLILRIRHTSPMHQYQPFHSFSTLSTPHSSHLHITNSALALNCSYREEFDSFFTSSASSNRAFSLEDTSCSLSPCQTLPSSSSLPTLLHSTDPLGPKHQPVKIRPSPT